ncbi:uncharacterized protein LOC144334888 [Macaca mulatta]
MTLVFLSRVPQLYPNLPSPKVLSSLATGVLDFLRVYGDSGAAEVAVGGGTGTQPWTEWGHNRTWGPGGGCKAEHIQGQTPGWLLWEVGEKPGARPGSLCDRLRGKLSVLAALGRRRRQGDVCRLPPTASRMKSPRKHTHKACMERFRGADGVTGHIGGSHRERRASLAASGLCRGSSSPTCAPHALPSPRPSLEAEAPAASTVSPWQGTDLSPGIHRGWRQGHCHLPGLGPSLPGGMRPNQEMEALRANGIQSLGCDGQRSRGRQLEAQPRGTAGQTQP